MIEIEEELHAHDDKVWYCAWSPDGQSLATCSSDKTIRLWSQNGSLHSGEVGNKWHCITCLEDGHERTIRSCEFSLSGRLLTSASFDGTVGVWEKDKKTGEWDMLATLEGHENEVKSLSWSVSGSYLATSSRDKSVWIWESLPDGDFECEAVLHGHTQDVKFVKWHPVEEHLFSCSYDDTIKIWANEADDWHCMATLTAHESTVWQFSFDSTGNRIVSCGDDGKAIVWKKFLDSSSSSVGTWRSVCTIDVSQEDPVYTIDWSKDFRVFLTGSGDNVIKGYLEDEGRTTGNPDCPSFVKDSEVNNAHTGDVNCIRWNPKETDIFASVGDDGAVKIWRYTPL
mmetsp:Transcript_12155/g.15745  ORF Transcript_12155/g.15745 Transcript_12155/m.15745 type:complete len:340 (+) Transcript_12155:3-1022(+)